MKKMKTSIALLFSVIVILAAISPALAETPQPSMRPRELTDSNSSSYNWAGYAVSDPAGLVTYVSGSWIVPSVSGSKKTTAYSAFWVGIDGLTPDSPTVEQIGTDSDIQNGRAVYYAWYEFYPKQFVQIITGFSISPGDTIFSSVSYSSNIFTLTITDTTNGNSKTITQDASTLGYSVKLNSAEWIAEAPSSFQGILPLANFGTVKYGQDYTSVSSTCSATINGVTSPIGSFTSSGYQTYQIDMIGTTRHGRTTTTYTKASTSDLTPDGTSFSVSWLNA